MLMSFLGGSKVRRILIQDYIRPDKSKRILDLCCGPCDILPHLEYLEYVGVDFSEEYIRHCKKEFSTRENTTFIVKDVNAFLNETDSSAKFDIVLLIGGMHHIDDASLLTLLHNIKKVLTPTGRLVTLDGCFEPQLSWITRKILASDRGQFVRTKEAWVKIFTSVFKDYQCVTRKDLLRIPYNHIIFYK